MVEPNINRNLKSRYFLGSQIFYLNLATFEELPIWQEARAVCMVIWKLTLKDSFARDFSLKDQINLYRALDRGHITQGEFDHAFNLCKELSTNIGNFMRYLRNSEMRGQKFVGR
jgi:hypothetical protein